MALKGVIQGAGGTGGGQLSGSGVTSVGLTAPAPFITGPAVTASGNLSFDFSGVAIPIAEGGTGTNNFTSNAVVITGPSSTAPLTSVVLPQQSSEFLNGMGVFAVPAGGGGGGGTGTVTSVDLAPPPGFTVSGNPITVAGTLNIARIAPDSVAFGGTGMGSFGPGLIMGGLTSTGPLRGLPLTNLTSQFLAGDGIFRIPVNPGGTVQSVALTMTSEFSITGSPILGSGTIDLGFKQPLAIAHGGTGLGSTGPGVILGGLTSTAPLQGLPLTNLTSTFLAGDGVFRTPPSGGGAGAGTVTSVALQLSSEFNVTGSPVTNSGTLMASWAFQAANTVLAGPTGAPSNTPAFRSLVNADIPQSMSGKTLTSSVIQNPTITTQLLPFGSSILWNMGSGVIALLGMDSTVVGMMGTPANVVGGSAVLRVMQLGTGLTNLQWNKFWRFEGGTKPTLSSGFGQVDVITLYLESTAAYGVARKNFL